MGLGKTVQSVSMLGFLQVWPSFRLMGIRFLSFPKYSNTNDWIMFLCRMHNKSTGHFLWLCPCQLYPIGQKNLGNGSLTWMSLCMLELEQAERLELISYFVSCIIFFKASRIQKAWLKVAIFITCLVLFVLFGYLFGLGIGDADVGCSYLLVLRFLFWSLCRFLFILLMLLSHWFLL